MRSGMHHEFGPGDTLCINTLRTLAIDAIERARSGHPGLPLGAAPMAYVLFARHLRALGTAPDWPDRDRFVLSAGHGSMLQYALLHLFGYDVTEADLRAFRQLGSRTPGHPERGVTAGVEATTGPLGQGAAMSVGMAIAERALAGRFNRPEMPLVDHRTYALVSDGDVMEGVAHEAAALAAHLRLGRLTWLYDANEVTLDGPASLCQSEDTAARFVAYGWQVLEIARGDDDLQALDGALLEARRSPDRPTLIIVRTTIGFGAPTKAGTSQSHGAPLGEAEAAGARAALGMAEYAPFAVPPQARTHVEAAWRRNHDAHGAWQALAARYRTAHPEAWAAFEGELRGELPAGWDDALADVPTQAPASTREAGGRVLRALAGRVPALLGGDADLSVSTLTTLAGGDFEGAGGTGRNVRFGVREHAMAAAAVGMACHGGVRPLTATFFVFSDYMRPSLRLAALCELPVLFVFTHDSLGVGEDGPTHQPIEHLAALRAIPRLAVLRPADTNEAIGCYRLALQRRRGPVALVLGRQKLPALPAAAGARAGAERGAYVVRDAPGAMALIIGTGSEVHLATAAAELLSAEGTAVRVVSMPSWEIFAEQPDAYREAVLPRAAWARVSVEAGVTQGWHAFVGARGVALGVDDFGASGPGPEVMAQAGLTPQRVAAAMRAVLAAGLSDA